MRYEILGPLRVVDEHGSRTITAPKVESLLAVLLSRRGEVIPVGSLLTELWPAQRPQRAMAGLHVYVSQLRKFLHRAEEPTSPILTLGSGYVLELRADDELDADRFITLATKGRSEADSAHLRRAGSTFERALAEWSGPVPACSERGPILNAYAAWLDRERLDCVERLMEVRLALGQHRAMISELYSLVAEHPFREPFYRQLMLALYRSERQADALMVYGWVQQALDQELGIAPCRTLQRLHHDILLADDRLELSAGNGAA